MLACIATLVIIDYLVSVECNLLKVYILTETNIKT